MSTDGKTHLPLLTTSAIRTWKQCHRLYKYKYVQLYRSIHKAGAVRFGSLFHSSLEAWWCADDGQDRLEAAFAAIDANEVDLFERARARAAMRGYHTRWASSDLRTHSVEQEFATELINPDTGGISKTWKLAGKLDVIARDGQGRLWLVEHKTSTADVSPGSVYWRHLRLDAQVSNYFTGARALGIELAGCVYDVIKRPQQTPGKAVSVVKMTQEKWTKCTMCKGKGCVSCVAGKVLSEPSRPHAGQRLVDETPDEFEARICEAIAEKPDEIYMRGEVVRLEEEVREAAADAWAAGREIRDAEIADRYPRNDDGCEKWGRVCEFLDVCERSASLSDETKYRRAETAHEELSTAAVAAE